MRFFIAFFVVVLSACASAPPIAEDAVTTNASAVSGLWVGKYKCQQGETSLQLSLSGTPDGLVEGTFLFYPTPSNARAATGKFIVRGWYYSDGSLLLSPGAWIEQPSGYGTVSLRGRIDTINHTFSGVIPECFNMSFSTRLSK